MKNADNKQTQNTKEAKVRCLKREYTSKQGQIREGKEERRRQGEKKEEDRKKNQEERNPNNEYGGRIWFACLHSWRHLSVAFHAQF